MSTVDAAIINHMINAHKMLNSSNCGSSGNNSSITNGVSTLGFAEEESGVIQFNTSSNSAGINIVKHRDIIFMINSVDDSEMEYNTVMIGKSDNPLLVLNSLINNRLENNADYTKFCSINIVDNLIEVIPGAIRIDSKLDILKDVSAPNIYTKTEVDALISSNTGGASSSSIPTEDVLTRYEGNQSGMDYNETYYQIIIEFNDRIFAPGNILRLRNKNGEIDSFIMVLFGKPTSDDPNEINMVLINTRTNAVINATMGHSGSDPEAAIRVRYVAGKFELNYEDYYDANGIDPEVGIFINEQMSYKTLCTVLRYINYYIPANP